MHLLLANPTAGSGKGKRITETVKKELLHRNLRYVDISGTSFESASTSLRQAISSYEPIESLIVVGGDGMVHLAIQQVAGTQIPILLIPAGTGNDLARSLNLDLNDPARNLELLNSDTPSLIDLGKSTEIFFADILSTGFDSIVNERANRIKRVRGRMKYNLAILLELPVFKPRSYRFVVDNDAFEVEAMLIAIANGSSYGGGMKVCPDAKLDDGFFDIMILEPVSKIEFLRVFPKVFSGAHISHPRVRILKGKRVRLDSTAVAYADGERIGPLPIEVEIVPRSLRVWRKS